MVKEALNEKQIKDLIEDKEFLKRLVRAENTEEVKEIFKSKGIEISDEDVKVLGQKVKESLEELKKLPEEEIEKIVGGVRGPIVTTTITTEIKDSSSSSRATALDGVFSGVTVALGGAVAGLAMAVCGVAIGKCGVDTARGLLDWICE